MNKMENKSFKRFLIIWAGQLISNIGSGLTGFALGIYAFQKTNSATSYSLILFFTFLPTFLLNPIGGVLSDRMNRRLMMIIGDLGSTIGLFFILFMMFAGISQMWVIYLGVAVSSIFVALQIPAYKASTTDLIDENFYSKTSGLMQLAESSRYLISPIIAGVLLNFMDIKYILMIDISTFLIAVIAVFWVKKELKISTPQRELEDFFTNLISGFRYTISHKGILWLLIIASLITFSVGFLQALIGPMILAFTDSKTYGTIMTVSATGMLISGFWIGIFSKIKKHVTILSISLAFAGIFYALLGFSTNKLLIIIPLFLFFFTLPFINTGLDVLIRKNVENNMQGRVWSIGFFISQFGLVIALCISGFLADYLFNPLFQANGLFASTIGRIIGTGQGRGIGFMFILAGIMVLVTAIIIGKVKLIRELDK